MKISNSKKKLAEIIHENGGWRDGAESAAQCIKGEISFWHDVATKRRGEDWCGSYLGSCEDIEFTGVKLPNWHQTILSRDEYFHLYPVPDADGWIEWNGGRKSPVGDGALVDVRLKSGTYYEAELLDDTSWSDTWWDAGIVAYRLYKPEKSLEELCGEVKEENKHEHVEAKPTIEKLASEYRNLLDFADRKQQEADAAKVDAEAKLAELVAAGKALGLGLSVAEPELVITDWRDLQLGDVIEYVDGRNKNRVGMIGRIDSFDLYNADTDRHVRMVSDNGQVGWPTKWRFIRRPAQGGDNA